MGNGLSVTSYNCAGCGAAVTRPPTKGQRPKWCAECRRIGARGRRTCAHCGTDFLGSGKRFCSLSCRSRFHAPPPRPKATRPPVDQRSPLRRALESEDWVRVLDVLEARAVKVEDCWLWPSKSKDGYGVARVAGRSFGVHRLAMAAHLGGPIPSHHPVHHRCAEPLCFKPEHLQVVTPHENNAEMLERQYYLKRIADLEAALRRRAPNHPLVA